MSRWRCGAGPKEPTVFLCAGRALAGLCWKDSPCPQGGALMARPQTDRLLQHLLRLAGGDTTAGSSDAELLCHYLGQGDEAAFTALVRRHGPMVWQVCLSTLGQREDAEDVFQATFLVLARKAGSVRKPESLACWLHGVALCLARNVRGRNLRRGAGKGEALRIPAQPIEDLTWREL